MLDIDVGYQKRKDKQRYESGIETWHSHSFMEPKTETQDGYVEYKGAMILEL